MRTTCGINDFMCIQTIVLINVKNDRLAIRSINNFRPTRSDWSIKPSVKAVRGRCGRSGEVHTVPANAVLCVCGVAWATSASCQVQRRVEGVSERGGLLLARGRCSAPMTDRRQTRYSTPNWGSRRDWRQAHWHCTANR